MPTSTAPTIVSLDTTAVRGVPPGTAILFDRARMELRVGLCLVVDVRTLLHDAGVVDRVHKHYLEDGSVTLPQRKGKYAHVTRTGRTYVARSETHSIATPSAGETAVLLARERRKRKNAPATPQDEEEEEEVAFTHEVTREERDALGRARAVELE